MTYLALHTFKCYTMEIILACPKCPTSYILYTDSIELDISGELIFTLNQSAPNAGIMVNQLSVLKVWRKSMIWFSLAKLKSRK